MTVPTDNKTEWITVEQAAERAGKSVSAIRGYVRQGLLTAYKRPLDARRYIRRDQLDALLTAEPKPVDDDKADE